MFALVMVAAVTRAFFLPVLHNCLLIFAVTPGASGPGNPVYAVSCHRPASTHGTQKWDFRVRIMLTISFQRVHRCPDKFFGVHYSTTSPNNLRRLTHSNLAIDQASRRLIYPRWMCRALYLRIMTVPPLPVIFQGACQQVDPKYQGG